MHPQATLFFLLLSVISSFKTSLKPLLIFFVSFSGMSKFWLSSLWHVLISKKKQLKLKRQWAIYGNRLQASWRHLLCSAQHLALWNSLSVEATDGRWPCFCSPWCYPGMTLVISLLSFLLVFLGLNEAVSQVWKSMTWITRKSNIVQIRCLSLIIMVDIERLKTDIHAVLSCF